MSQVDQNSASEFQPNLSFNILTKLRLKMLTKLELQNLDQTSASKSQPRYLEQSSASKSLPNCCQYSFNDNIDNIKISNSNNINKLGWHLHTPGSHQSSQLGGS